MGRDEDWDWAADWLPSALAIGDGPCSGVAGGESLSAGCLSGSEEWREATSDSGSGMKDTGGLRLSLYPISPRLVGNGSACG